MTELELFRIAIVLIGTGIAAYFDVFNKKNVPDLFLYGFLGIALFVNIFDFSVFLSILPIAGMMIILLYLMYRIGQIGGADVIVIASIFCALPSIQDSLLSQPPIFPDVLPIQLPSIFSILAISAFLFAISTVLKFGPKIAKRISKGKKLSISPTSIIQTIILVVIYGFFLFIAKDFIGVFISINYLLFVTVVILIILFFSLFKDTITEMMVSWRKIVYTEDVIALESIDRKIVEKYKLGRLVTEDQLKRMKKLKRKWPVLDLPMFLPYIFVALIIYILFGDPLFYPI